MKTDRKKQNTYKILQEGCKHYRGYFFQKY